MLVQIALSVIFAVFQLSQVSGHGMMLQPINRASLWRIDWNQPANYEDNQYFCGGVEAQYKLHGGKCGVCGDNYSDPIPRSNENGGTYGKGVIVANYTEGSVIEASSTLTANHLGSIHYSLCVLDEDPSAPEQEECFQPLLLEDGSLSHAVQDLEYFVHDQVQLPDGLTCDRCVLRWHYRTGNSWGLCDNGLQGMGCGNQEVFRSCADISIKKSAG